jgi:acetyltransferase-like isoleucine patch superfamily enzyme
VRQFVKAVVRGVATLVVLPSLGCYWISSLLFGRDRALQNSTQALAFLPGHLGQYLRRAFLARTLAYCARSATIEFGTTFSQTGARIEENVYIGPNCHIGLVHIERDVLIAAGVHIPSGPETHGIADPSLPIREQPGTLRQVRIGAGAWIGSAAVVMADVGRETVVGAGAVVSRPLPERVIALTAPARLVQQRLQSTAARA